MSNRELFSKFEKFLRQEENNVIEIMLIGNEVYHNLSLKSQRKLNDIWEKMDIDFSKKEISNDSNKTR